MPPRATGTPSALAVSGRISSRSSARRGILLPPRPGALPALPAPRKPELVRAKTRRGMHLYTLFASNEETTPGTQTSAWSRGTKNSQASPTSVIAAYGATLASSSSSGLTGTGAVTYGTSSTNSYVGTVSPSVGGYFVPTGGFSLEDNFSQVHRPGLAEPLDLYRLRRANTNVDPLGQSSVIPPAGQAYVGSFNFTSAGVLDFSTNASSFAPIPEPSNATPAPVGVGSLLLMAWYRRRIQRTMA